MLTVPICEAAGHSTFEAVWYPNWASLHEVIVLPPDGLIPIPSGNVTLATFRYELAIGALGSQGIPRSTVVASGLSTALAPSAVTVISGLNGTFAQPVAPDGVVYLAEVSEAGSDSLGYALSVSVD